MNHKQNAEKYFAEELAYIQNKEIKEFVLDVFDKLTPDYFWTTPASTSGKWHPQISSGIGGLIRHTKLAVWWGYNLLESMQMEQYHDEMVAALLLHDLIKRGKGLDAGGRPLERGVIGTHGVTLAEKIRDGLIDGTLHLDFKYRVILIGIAIHMGIWTTKVYATADEPENKSWDKFINLIYLADYCASRKVDVKMLELNELVVRKNPCPRCKTGELYDANAGGMFCAIIKCDNLNCVYTDSSDACGCVTA